MQNSRPKAPGMSLRKSAIAFGLFTGLVSLTPVVRAADLSLTQQISGQIEGEVRNPSGVAQMGASVMLYNAFGQLVRQALSNDKGGFVFDALMPDTYSIRVSLVSFVPAIRRNIAVLAGSEKLLTINLAGVFSSVELAPSSSSRGTLMSDDWKWVLRSSSSTRPVLRFLPQTSSSRAHSRPRFSDTTGLVRVSAGDSNLVSGGPQEDLGTAFALATSLNGSTRVRVSGNFAYAANGLPSAGFRTTYARAGSAGATSLEETSDVSVDGTTTGPRMTLTVRQIYLPSLSGAVSPDQGNSPVLRTGALSTIDKFQLTDHLALDYGFSFETVSLFGRINNFSPFARADYDAGDHGTLQIAFSAGAAPTELVTGGAPALDQDIAALGQLPRISRRDNQAEVERTKVYEAGYQVKQGSRTYSASIFREEVTNGTFLISGATAIAGADDLLPDINSRGVIFNLGDYQRGGFAGSVTQALGNRMGVAAAAGRSDALVEAQPSSLNGDDLRSGIRKAPRAWATARADASLPVTGTHLAGSYGWSDFRALMPNHVSLTSKIDQQIGWNFYARQPLPNVHGMRMELTAELRNLLAQGYLSMQSNGQTVILTNSPRAVRGGLNFIF